MKPSNLPWWLKISAKLLMGILPLPYEKVRCFVTGHHGGMDKPAYAKAIFDKFTNELENYNYGPFENKTLLELGPGGSLFTGILARHAGFKRVILIDVGDFAIRDPHPYSDMIKKTLCEEDQYKFKSVLMDTKDIIKAFAAINVYYYTRGLSSLQKLPSNCISFSFSNAVLEHVLLNEFNDTMSELYRVHMPMTLSCHQIDYRDHVGGALNNLRFSKKIWESRFFPNQGFYTNRLRHHTILQNFKKIGFYIIKNRTFNFDKNPIMRSEISHDFKNIDKKTLLIRGAYFVLQKK